MKLKILILVAYLNMNAEVTIGQLVFNHISNFTIEQSVKELSDTATVVIPRNLPGVMLDGKTIVPILDYIRPGMKVEIKCGYNGGLQTEFTGYVKPGISADYPTVIECDELFPLRHTNHILSYKQVTLKELLEDITTGFKIECPSVSLGKVLIKNGTSTIQVLDYLKKHWGFFTKVRNDTLYVFWPYNLVPSSSQNIYTIGKNVRNPKGLKFQTAIGFDTEVNVTFAANKGKGKTVKFGGEGEKTNVKNYKRLDIKTEKDALELAKSIKKQSTYDGYKGTIEGFCYPAVQAGDSLTIVDPKKPEREGTYLVEKMVLEYDIAHIKRVNHLSYKI